MPGVMVDDISFSQESSASSCASTVIFDSLMAAAAAANPAMQQDHIKSLFSHSDLSDTWALPQSPYLHNSGGYGSPGFNSPRSTPAMEILRREESSQLGSNMDPFGGMYGMDFFSPKENVIESRGSSLLRAKLGGSLHCDVKDMYSDLSAYCESPMSSLVGSPTLPDAVAALHKFLPSNNEDSAENIYACDEFRMYEFKVRRCMRGRSHDWTECPFAHPGEKARRRDPRRVPYLGTACPDFRKGNCKQGDACEYAHGVFECWLHPARYRTQPCKDGRNCRRRVCFFAHTPEQLRILPNTPQNQNGSPRGLSRSGMKTGFSSPQTANFGRSLDGSSQNGCFDAAFDGFGHGNNGFEVSAMKHGNHHAPKLNNTHYPYASSHISSPTSPLEGLAHSPPPLFPPLSPSDSPPLSPSSSPENWLNPQGHPLSVAAARSALSQSPTSLSEVQALLMAHNQNHNMLNHNFSAENRNMQSPPHRRSLERMNSMPSVPSSNGSNFDQRRILQSFSSFSPSHASGRPASPNMASSRAMNNLLATLQQLDLKGGSSPLWPQPNQMPYSSGRSPLHRSSDISNKLGWDDRVGELWEMDVGEVQRVESGKHFRAEVYGRVGKENLPDSNDSPDLGWVNELVKE